MQNNYFHRLLPPLLAAKIIGCGNKPRSLFSVSELSSQSSACPPPKVVLKGGDDFPVHNLQQVNFKNVKIGANI